MNATNILERDIARQSNVPDRRSSGSGQIPLSEIDSPVYYGVQNRSTPILSFLYITRRLSWLTPYPPYAVFWIVMSEI